MRQITLYNPSPVACHPYDPQVPKVARLLSELIHDALQNVEVEHIGSSSVTDCAGKGYIDLMVLYTDGGLDATKAGLATLGFQRQTSRDPFPEERPMRVGAFAHCGESFTVHAHVLAVNSPEVEELRWFRETLRSNERLREEYVAEKQCIIAAGVLDSVEYCLRKATFVQRVLAMRERF